METGSAATLVGGSTAAACLVAAIDCGTTAIKAGVFDLAGGLRGFAARPCPRVPRSMQPAALLRGVRSADGLIENDPQAFVRETLICLRDSLRPLGAARKRVAALAITNQRATVLCVDDHGRPIGNAISWQDMRGAGEIEALRRRISDGRYFKITGLPNHPVFTLAKILWIRKHDRARDRRTRRFALVQDYLLKELGCEDFFCDWSNASLTGLMDVARFRWSRAILDETGIEGARLPILVPSGARVGALSGAAARDCGLLEGTPLISGGGDQQCAGIGSCAVRPGVVEITLGTAAAPLCFSAALRLDPRRRVTCCAHAVAGKWELEGLQNCAGASLGWLRRLFGGRGRFPAAFFRSGSGTPPLSVERTPPGAGGLLFYPYLAGAAAPHWEPNARGAFLGLTLAHDRPALARAVLEGVSMETREILEVFASMRAPVREVRLTGGCAAIEAWDQILADVLGKPVSTLENPQASLLGAAILAACGVGLFNSAAEAADRMVRVRRTYRPAPARVEVYQEVFERFCRTRRDMGQAGLFETTAREE